MLKIDFKAIVIGSKTLGQLSLDTGIFDQLSICKIDFLPIVIRDIDFRPIVIAFFGPKFLFLKLNAPQCFKLDKVQQIVTKKQQFLILFLLSFWGEEGSV